MEKSNVAVDKKKKKGEKTCRRSFQSNPNGHLKDQRVMNFNTPRLGCNASK